MSPDAQCPAIRHGVAGIDGKVDDHLFELVDIDQHEAQVAFV